MGTDECNAYEHQEAVCKVGKADAGKMGASHLPGKKIWTRDDVQPSSQAGMRTNYVGSKSAHSIIVHKTKANKIRYHSVFLHNIFFQQVCVGCTSILTLCTYVLEDFSARKCKIQKKNLTFLA